MCLSGGQRDYKKARCLMDGIIGSSGLVGSLLRDIVEAKCYTSSNIQTIAGEEFDTIWVAAPSAVKWQANANPAADMDSISRLLDAIGAARARRVVHFSTVDVYGAAQLATGPHESDRPVSDCAYGKHRHILEESWKADVVQIVRLPGLFGRGLKKNIIFDLLQKRNYDSISLMSSYQWYDLSDLPSLISDINDEKNNIINVSVEPVITRDIVSEIFPEVLEKCMGASAVRYDMRSKNGYRFSREEVIERVRRYAEQCRGM